MRSILLLIILFYLYPFNTPISYAHNHVPNNYQQKPGYPGPIYGRVTVTARVPLSDVWAEAIAQNSEVDLVTLRPIGAPSLIRVTIKGYREERMKGQEITAQIYQNEKIVETVKGRTNDEGSIVLSFTPQESGSLIIQITNTTYERKVFLKKQLNVSPPTLMSTQFLT